MAQDEAVKDSIECYQDALDVSSRQREQIKEDLAFSDPSNPRQWDEAEKSARESDPGGARPCLVFDLVGQYIANVAGQVEKRPPSIHVIPVDGGADVKVAEQLDGVYRAIEYASRAQQHYARALTSAARAGVGYLLLRPEITDAALNYQMPMISSEGDPLRVLIDPWSVEIDGSDADFGFLLTPLSHKQFERKFGKDAKKVSFGDDDVSDERESIIFAEEWRTLEKTRVVVTYTDEDGHDSSMPEEDFMSAIQQGQRLQPTGTYKDKYKCVKWRRMSGAEVLEEEREYPASGIGIIPVYGYVGYSDGRMSYCGLPRRARAPQQAYNHSVSEIRAYMDQAPKAPWVASLRAMRGLEKLWERASVESRGVLPFNDIDEMGQAIAAPTRLSPTTNLQNLMASAENARNDIQAALGMYAANIGQASNETSGVAIDARKEQGEASTAHFPSHLSASLGQIGRLCLEMIPRLIDTKRQIRIMGIDSKPGSITIDPKQDKALSEGEGRGVVINPSVGSYDVRVVVGASYSTQRAQAQEAYTEMMRANPAIMPAIAPLWAQTLDVPHTDKLAQVLTAMAPPEVRDILQPSEDGESKEQLKAKLGDATKALEEATRLAKEAQADADQAHAKLAEQAEEMAQNDDEMSIKAYEAMTNRLKVTSVMMRPEEVQAIAQQTVMAMLTQPDPTEDPEASQVAEAMEPPQEEFQPMEAPSEQEMAPPGDEFGGEPPPEQSLQEPAPGEI